ncbi:MAG: ABC transporter permease [Pseudanabaenaceae cyanobacterium]
MVKSSKQIVAIAHNVLRETIREQVLYLLLLFAAILGSAFALLPQFTGLAERDLIPDVGMAAIEIVGLVVVAFVGANLINREIDRRTILPLLAKPIGRWDFLVGKLLGLWTVLGMLIFAMTTLLVVFLKLVRVDLPLGAVFTSSFFLWLQFFLLGTFALFYGSFTSSLVASLLTLATYLVGQFSADLLQLGKISRNPAVEKVTQTLFLLLPDLSRTNLKNLAVYGVLPPPGELFASAVYTVSYALLVLAVAIVIFGKKEF